MEVKFSKEKVTTFLGDAGSISTEIDVPYLCPIKDHSDFNQENVKLTLWVEKTVKRPADNDSTTGGLCATAFATIARRLAEQGQTINKTVVKKQRATQLPFGVQEVCNKHILS